VGGVRCFLARYIASKAIISSVSSEKPGITRRVPCSAVATVRLLSVVSYYSACERVVRFFAEKLLAIAFTSLYRQQ
jgi:hypothetical protein